MSELRLNIITREWVVIAPERALRPDQFKHELKLNSPAQLPPLFDDNCPFCPGHEQHTPGELARHPTSGPWQMRVVPNKFSALAKQSEQGHSNQGLHHSVSGYGLHEVVIESDLHNLHLAKQPLSALSNLLEIFKTRFIAMYEDPAIAHVTIFKNHGEAAGTSLIHPHSQIIGTPITPIQISNRRNAARHYFADTGECLMCASLADELVVQERIILDTAHFTTFIPYAALSPFHTWIFPKRHSACFADINTHEIAELALHLKTILGKMLIGLNNPSYNFVIRSESTHASQSPDFHWYISIVPRLNRPAGFELGSGMYINSSAPEDSATFLRDIKISTDSSNDFLS